MILYDVQVGFFLQGCKAGSVFKIQSMLFIILKEKNHMVISMQKKHLTKCIIAHFVLRTYTKF